MLGRFANRQSLSIVFISAALCLGGVYAATSISSSVFPQTDFPRVVILVDNGVMPGDEMMARITRPIEEAMKDIPGTVTVKSATGRGSAEINVFFTWQVDMVQSELYVLSRLGQIRSHAPRHRRDHGLPPDLRRLPHRRREPHQRHARHHGAVGGGALRPEAALPADPGRGPRGPGRGQGARVPGGGGSAPAGGRRPEPGRRHRRAGRQQPRRARRGCTRRTTPCTSPWWTGGCTASGTSRTSWSRPPAAIRCASGTSPGCGGGPSPSSTSSPPTAIPPCCSTSAASPTAAR